MALDLKKIKWYPAPEKEYHQEQFKKEQVVIHHTASGGNSKGDMDYLNGDQQGAVNVAFFIDRDGTIWQAFSSKYWSAHLGIPQTTFVKFNIKNTCMNIHKMSVAIELDSWGYLDLKGGKFLSYSGTAVRPENVVIYPEKFLGQKYYEKYYPEQLASLKDLLIYLCDTYSISKDYNCDMWGVSANALAGTNGIWTHVSYRESGKWDCHPQPELIEILKSLN
ncbi:MAG: N-acetylmuramoyl-L-alanine amidase [Pedobacter sp.]